MSPFEQPLLSLSAHPAQPLGGEARLDSAYASGFNRRWWRRGALFQGRFKAVLVEKESHALELSRYVHLNAARARIVEQPEEYAWSSYQDCLGVRKAPAWLDWQTVVAELAKDLARARSAPDCRETPSAD